MSSSDAHVVVLGAGHAGGTLVALLRQYGFAGPITMVGDEPIALPDDAVAIAKIVSGGQFRYSDDESEYAVFLTEYPIGRAL